MRAQPIRCVMVFSEVSREQEGEFMPIFDKVKAQATQLAQKAQEAGKAGQSKIEEVQARRRADVMLRDLGAAVYAERSGRADATTAADIARILTELSDFESEHGPIGSHPASDPDDSGNPLETAPIGNFTL